MNKNITQNKFLPPLEVVREEVLKAVEAWEKEELRVDPGNAAYFCPVCTRVKEISKRRRGVPRCPVYQVDMSRLDQEGERFWRKRKKELADLLRRRLDGVLELFWRSAEAYAPVPELKWHLESGGEGYAQRLGLPRASGDGRRQEAAVHNAAGDAAACRIPHRPRV